MLNKPAAANLSLGLVVVGWLLAIFTVIRNFGDPDPRIPAAELHRAHVAAAVSLWAAIILILISLLLAGFAFREAKRRALVTVTVALLPILALWMFATSAGI
jgi:cytochrome b561